MLFMRGGIGHPQVGWPGLGPAAPLRFSLAPSGLSSPCQQGLTSSHIMHAVPEPMWDSRPGCPGPGPCSPAAQRAALGLMGGSALPEDSHPISDSVQIPSHKLFHLHLLPSL